MIAHSRQSIGAIAVLLLFLTTAIVLPTNSLAGLPAKMGTTGILFLYMATRLRHAADFADTLRKPAVVFLIGCGFILAFMLVSAARGQVSQEYIVAEGRGQLVMLLVAVAISIYQPLTGTSARAIAGCLLAAVAIYAVVKLAIFFAMADGVVSSLVVRAAIYHVFGYAVLMGQIHGSFIRMQFPSDMLAVMCVVFLLPGMPPAIRLWWPVRIVLALLFVAVAVTAWSRLLLAAVVVLPAGALFLQWPRRTVQISVLLCGLAALWLLLSEGVSNGFIDLLSDRFFGQQTAWSDDLRAQQIPALLDMFAGAPFFGQGVGSYAPAVIRDIAAPFSYEEQLVALLMKFGLAGTAVLAGAALFLLRYFLVTIRRPNSYVLAGEFCLLLAASLTNPYLESSMSGIVIGCLLSVAADPSSLSADPPGSERGYGDGRQRKESTA